MNRFARWCVGVDRSHAVFAAVAAAVVAAEAVALALAVAHAVAATTSFDMKSSLIVSIIWHALEKLINFTP